MWAGFWAPFENSLAWALALLGALWDQAPVWLGWLAWTAVTYQKWFQEPCYKIPRSIQYHFSRYHGAFLVTLLFLIWWLEKPERGNASWQIFLFLFQIEASSVEPSHVVDTWLCLATWSIFWREAMKRTLAGKVLVPRFSESGTLTVNLSIT